MIKRRVTPMGTVVVTARIGTRTLRVIGPEKNGRYPEEELAAWLALEKEPPRKGCNPPRRNVEVAGATTNGFDDPTE